MSHDEVLQERRREGNAALYRYRAILAIRGFENFLHFSRNLAPDFLQYISENPK